MTARRLDLALQAAGLARSRTHARRIIEEGRARVDGKVARKPSTPVTEETRLEVADVPDGVEYASRAAHKLRRALESTGVAPAGRRCLDAGASTGGFTDVLLRRGAAEVIAVDIGHDQLVDHVRTDPRVRVMDGTSVRDLEPHLIGGVVDVLVADLSFISLRTVIAQLSSVVRPDGELLLMVKPQFEVGREALPRGGVVTDPAARAEAVAGVARSGGAVGLETLGCQLSALPGQDGNREFFLHLRRRGGTCALSRTAYDMIESAARASAAPAPEEITDTQWTRPSAAPDTPTREDTPG